MAIKEWKTVFPSAIDTTTEQPTLVAGDATRVSQMHAIRNANQTLQAQVGKVAYVHDHGNDISRAVNWFSGSLGQVKIISGSALTLSSDYSVPSNITLDLDAGANITVNPGVAFSPHGGFRAGRYKVLTVSGILSGSPKLDAVYPEWFGAIADDSTDCHAAIQKAIDWQQGPVVLGNGTYRTSDTIRVYGSGITFKGQGRLSTTIRATTDFSASYVVHVGSSTGRVGEAILYGQGYNHNMSIGDFEIVGTATVDGMMVGGEVSTYSVLGKFDNIWIRICKTGLRLENVQGTMFTNVNCTSNITGLLCAANDAGSTYAYANTATTFTRCRFTSNTGVGAHIAQANGMSWINCNFEQNALQGLLIDHVDHDGVSGWQTDNLLFLNCWSEQNLTTPCDAGTGHRGDIEISVVTGITSTIWPRSISFINHQSSIYPAVSTDYAHVIYINALSPVQHLVIEGGHWTTNNNITQKIRIEHDNNSETPRTRVTGRVQNAMPLSWFTTGSNAIGSGGLTVIETLSNTDAYATVENQKQEMYGGRQEFATTFGLRNGVGTFMNGSWQDVVYITKVKGVEGHSGYIKAVACGLNNDTLGNVVAKTEYLFSLNGAISPTSGSVSQLSSGSHSATHGSTGGLSLQIVTDHPNNRLAIQVSGSVTAGGGTSWSTGRVFVDMTNSGAGGRSGLQITTAGV